MRSICKIVRGWHAAVLVIALTSAGATDVMARTVVEGPFVGVLPCADCPGIRTELALERDAGTGAPRRYWLRETYLDAGAGRRKREFTAPAPRLPKDEEKGEPAAARLPAEDGREDGTGSIESTLDARSVESLGAWSESAVAGRTRIAVVTANGPRYFARVSERVVESLSREGGRITSAQNQSLALRAGGVTPLASASGTQAAGMVTRDARGRLVLDLCGNRGAVVLTDAARAPSIEVALESIDFARAGRAFLEIYGDRRGVSFDARRLARASVDLDCTTAAPAPLALAVNGGDAGWTVRADADGVRLDLPGAGRNTQRGSTAQALAWTWRDGVAAAAGATLISGDVLVRTVPRLCRDTMSNTVYGFSAEMRLGGQRYEGCAWSAAFDQP